MIGLNSKRMIYIGIIVLLNIIGIISYALYFFKNGYLPSPFLYDKSDTFMDFFNVLYWSYSDGRYTEWGSVYPPINFIFIKLINFISNGNEFGDPLLMRDSSFSAIVFIFAGYFLVPLIVLKNKYWQNFTISEISLIYLAIITSSPMLYALERGNLIIITPIFLAIMIAKTGVARCMTIGLLINIKSYFAILLFYYIARNDWKGFFYCILFSGLIFLSTGLLLDENFIHFFYNTFKFSQVEELFSVREIFSMPTSISIVSYLLKNEEGSDMLFSLIPKNYFSKIDYVIEIFKWTLIFFSFYVIFINHKKILKSEILATIIIIISNLGIWVGGYSIIFYIVLIPILSNMNTSRLLIFIISLMSLPLDLIVLIQDSIGYQYSYLSDFYTVVTWELGLGSILRPFINLILLLLISTELILRKNKVSTFF